LPRTCLTRRLVWFTHAARSTATAVLHSWTIFWFLLIFFVSLRSCSYHGSFSFAHAFDLRTVYSRAFRSTVHLHLRFGHFLWTASFGFTYQVSRSLWLPAPEFTYLFTHAYGCLACSCLVHTHCVALQFRHTVSSLRHFRCLTPILPERFFDIRSRTWIPHTWLRVTYRYSLTLFSFPGRSRNT